MTHPNVRADTFSRRGTAFPRCTFALPLVDAPVYTFVHLAPFSSVCIQSLPWCVYFPLPSSFLIPSLCLFLLVHSPSAARTLSIFPCFFSFPLLSLSLPPTHSLPLSLCSHRASLLQPSLHQHHFNVLVYTNVCIFFHVHVINVSFPSGWLSFFLYPPTFNRSIPHFYRCFVESIAPFELTFFPLFFQVLSMDQLAFFKFVNVTGRCWLPFNTNFLPCHFPVLNLISLICNSIIN